jgi:hypothetical protein
VNCGNGTCQMGETCTNCPMDCHNCTPTSDVCNHNHTCEFGWESCSFCSDCCLGGGDGGWYSQCDGDYNCKGGYKCSHYEGYCVAEWLLQE